MVTYKKPISTLIVIYTEALQTLLLKRTDLPDAWQSVTGSQEEGENLRETAIREVREETGIDINDPTLGLQLVDWQITNEYTIYPQWIHRYAPNVTTNTEHVFALKLATPLPIILSLDEHTAYKWIEWHVAAEMVFSPSNAEAIRLLPEKERN